jgi:hypothetical protein
MVNLQLHSWPGEKKQGNLPIKMAGDPTENRAHYFLNASIQRYRYTSLLSLSQ